MKTLSEQLDFLSMDYQEKLDLVRSIRRNREEPQVKTSPKAKAKQRNIVSELLKKGLTEADIIKLLEEMKNGD